MNTRYCYPPKQKIKFITLTNTLIVLSHDFYNYIAVVFSENIACRDPYIHSDIK